MTKLELQVKQELYEVWKLICQYPENEDYLNKYLELKEVLNKLVRSNQNSKVFLAVSDK